MHDKEQKRGDRGILCVCMCLPHPTLLCGFGCASVQEKKSVFAETAARYLICIHIEKFLLPVCFFVCVLTPMQICVSACRPACTSWGTFCHFCTCSHGVSGQFKVTLVTWVTHASHLFPKPSGSDMDPTLKPPEYGGWALMLFFYLVLHAQSISHVPGVQSCMLFAAFKGNWRTVPPQI